MIQSEPCGSDDARPQEPSSSTGRCGEPRGGRSLESLGLVPLEGSEAAYTVEMRRIVRPA